MLRLSLLALLMFRPRLSRDSHQPSYDYIVVGGGTAGCVVAARLSEDPTLSVLLLEAGGSESIVSDFPIAVLNLQNTPLDWSYKTEVQSSSCFGIQERRLPWPRGKVLGGCSTLNYMMYVRGNRLDYDKWQSIGCQDWNWTHVFPFFLKSEDNRDPSLAFSGFHGRGGPLTVSTNNQISPVAHAFIEGGKHLGYPNADINGLTQSAFMIPQATIRRGARCSTAKAFLEPNKSRTNLHVMTFAFVTKVLFDESKRAIGVSFDRFGRTHIVRARKEVILSAGTINSAQLLMLSGIGPKKHLKSLGIPLIEDLPVGLNLQDHIYSGGLHYTLDKEESSYMQRNIQKPKHFLKYLTQGSGPLASTGGLEGLAFIKTRLANHSIDFPDIEIHLVCACLSSDDGRTFRHNIGISDDIWRHFYAPLVGKECFSLFPVLLRPKSRGFLLLRSRSPYDPPIIQPNYLTHEHDIHTLVQGLRETLRLGETKAFKALGARLESRLVPGCEVYAQWSDAYLACLARTLTHTIYHPVGTVRMGSSRDKKAVLDSRLRVKGVSRLRVADGSVMPFLVSGNTNAPIIMIAERASHFIRNKII